MAQFGGSARRSGGCRPALRGGAGVVFIAAEEASGPGVRLAAKPERKKPPVACARRITSARGGRDRRRDFPAGSLSNRNRNPYGSCHGRSAKTGAEFHIHSKRQGAN